MYSYTVKKHRCIDIIPKHIYAYTMYTLKTCLYRHIETNTHIHPSTLKRHRLIDANTQIHS